METRKMERSVISRKCAGLLLQPPILAPIKPEIRITVIKTSYIDLRPIEYRLSRMLNASFINYLGWFVFSA